MCVVSMFDAELGRTRLQRSNIIWKKNTTQELQGTATRMVARALSQLIIICVCSKSTGMTQAKLKSVCKKPSLD